MEKKNNAMNRKDTAMGTGAKKVELSRRASSHPAARRSASDLTNIQIVTRKKEEEKKPFPWTTVFTAVCFTLMFLFMMMNYITLDDLSEQVTERSNTIDSLISERDKLETKVAKMDTVEEIQKYAENELGMTAGDGTVEEYHIEIHTQDGVEINKYEDEVENGIGTLLTGAGSVLKAFFGG